MTYFISMPLFFSSPLAGEGRVGVDSSSAKWAA